MRLSRRDVAIHVFTFSFLLLWYVTAKFLPPYILPDPVVVARSLLQLLTTAGGLWHVFASLLHIAASLVAAFLLGLAIAHLPYYLPVFRVMIDGRFTPFVNAFPGIGWTMLAIVWLGIGFETIVFSVAIILLPFMIVNIREGLKALDNELDEMARSFGRNRWRVFQLIVLPALAPFLFAAVRVSLGVAWKVTLTAELLGGTDGIGYLMNIARQELDTPLVFALIVLIVLLVFVINRSVIELLQRATERHLPARA